ncbi:hypothetical protein DSO57_1009068 [Entomophthora muscae]|uniref:Uncharacterized protein n=1 Tax=Entomophthora muscae TaxID=34485 RepID=A0ACC2RLS5_9FUNG|nr:hypothetical protein DSO57_1009068 [Entomophthora muscae]
MMKGLPLIRIGCLSSQYLQHHHLCLSLPTEYPSLQIVLSLSFIPWLLSGMLLMAFNSYLPHVPQHVLMNPCMSSHPSAALGGTLVDSSPVM